MKKLVHHLRSDNTWSERRRQEEPLTGARLSLTRGVPDGTLTGVNTHLKEERRAATSFAASPWRRRPRANFLSKCNTATATKTHEPQRFTIPSQVSTTTLLLITVAQGRRSLVVPLQKPRREGGRATSCHATPLHSTPPHSGWSERREGQWDGRGQQRANPTRPIPPASAGTLTGPRCRCLLKHFGVTSQGSRNLVTQAAPSTPIPTRPPSPLLYHRSSSTSSSFQFSISVHLHLSITPLFTFYPAYRHNDVTSIHAPGILHAFTCPSHHNTVSDD
ncbi:hypothetical protein E2C01_044171 [Portunus trituberculatus]|uniref:Uncharacterized protein n=1 Tax=Portunus trituberculatus TaxID=210409 RepID=A0A5B7FZ88_PORTR|nr:hypothetical protein [Portunus trituberculatus]